jgi:two-component system sensor histidine kinase KdpD
MARGTLRVYLGAAPGVGKTFAMLNEGRRARERGADVVVGFVETHGRARTAEQIGDLETIPRRRVDYRGTTFEEMDVDAVLARRPERVLVDELAHTNVPGCRNAKRWQDVEELLDAGIDVIGTVNVQHLESLNDVVEQITGVPQRETIPDEFVRGADQIELVDQTPEALRRRMAHGNIYAPEKIDAALANYFRVGNLTALRELALLWLADRVDDALEDYRERHGISQPWETRERVVVALSGAPGREHVIRRAARIAQRAHGELIGVHVQRDDGLAGPANESLDRHRDLLRELGGSVRVVTGADIAAALVGFARKENATQIVLGATSRSRWQELTQGSIINRVVRLSGTIDVHVISQDAAEGGARLVMPTPSRALLAPLPPRRRMTAFLLAAVGLPLLTVGLAAARDSVGLPSVLLIYLVAVLAIGAVGGALPALFAAVSAFLLANWYFTPPLYRFTVGERENVLALVVFVVAASLVSYLVDVAARRREELTRVRVEAEALARMAGSLTQEDVLPRFVEQVRVTFAAHGVAVLRDGDGDGGGDGRREVEAASGEPVPDDPEAADATEPLGPGRTLVVHGVRLDADDDRLLHSLAAQTALALETRRLQAEAAHATELAQANDLRAGLLQSVSHDLRTPLASIKAAITSLRQTDLAWGPDQVADFEATIEDETDRLTALVESLLDMSRLQAGVLSPRVRATSLEAVVLEAVAGLGPRARAVVIDVPEDLPPVQADPQLLSRVVASLVDNAITCSNGARPPRVTAGAVAGRVLLRVVDQGSGIGPGLAIARGLTEAMGGELAIEDTPGGGTTMVVTLATP